MSFVLQRRFRRALGVGGLAVAVGALVLSGSAERARSSAPAGVVHIEEDWVLELNQPQGNVDSPQYHTVMSPYADFDENYAQVLWNYRETPSFTAGGVQMQGYYGETLTATRSLEFRKLDTSAETIRWTQSLTTDGVTLTFEVKNGTSQTWGGFGKDMRLDYAANLADLSSYSPDFSVEQSGVSYGTNRVDLMMIAQVRYYDAGGNLLYTDANPKVVFQLDQAAQ